MECKSWADVASGVVGAPPGFRLFRYSPLGWGHAPLSNAPPSAILASCSSGPPVVASRFHGVLRRRWPTLWFSYYTPCATQYELKYCRRTLAQTTVTVVDRSFSERCGKEGTAPLTGSTRTQVSDAAYRMASDQKMWILRLMAFIGTKLLSWLYGTDVYIDEDAVKQIQALQKTHTLIYAPTHKSHLDSIVMGYTMFAYGLEPPHIAAGENLELPLLSFLMRGSGAFFIRRSNKHDIDRDLYKKTLSGFIEALLLQGKHIEFFVEGGRARDGCVLRPRLGILSSLVDAFIDAELPKSGNVAVVPVHISYDHPIEENAMISELMGQPKETETLWGFIKALTRIIFSCWTQTKKQLGMGGRCGCATIAFGKPLHLKMLFRSLSRGVKGDGRGRSTRTAPRLLSASRSVKRNDLLTAAFPPLSDERYRAVHALGTAIHTQLSRIHIVPASSIVYCTIFVQSFLHWEIGRRMSMEEILKSVAKLQGLLSHAGAQFMGFDTDCKRTTIKRLHGFTERFDQWIDFQEASIKPDEGSFSVLPCMASSVVYYIRSNHLLGKMAPMCIIASALVACLHGFGQRHSEEGSSDPGFCAPRQSDFRPVPCADRASIIAAAMWLREILSPELDCFLGEEGYRTQADLQQMLDSLLNDGVLTPCIPPRKLETKHSSSVDGSSIASGTIGTQRKSVDRVVDKSRFPDQVTNV